MQDSDDNSKPTKLEGTMNQVLDFDLLDENTREAVIKCIKEKGKISVQLKNSHIVPDLDQRAFRQLID